MPVYTKPLDDFDFSLSVVQLWPPLPLAVSALVCRKNPLVVPDMAASSVLNPGTSFTLGPLYPQGKCAPGHIA
jgi:hypothetical protein